MPRPERFVTPVLGAAMILVAWEGVAHASGSGWVQAVGTVVAGMLTVGMTVPAFVARSLELSVVSSPGDAVTGEPFAVTVISERGLRCTVLEPGGGATAVSPHVPAAVTVVPPYRGVIRSIRVQLATAAPFGLLWWWVEREIVLDRPVLVSPQPVHRLAPVERSGHSAEGAAAPTPSLIGDTRQLRPYRLGDSRRQVHWSATAHSGSLIVRETEEQSAQPVRVLADLVGEPDATEREAGACLGTVAAYLLAGARVLLETTEQSRRVCAPVTDVAQAGRRLARAGTNPYESSREAPARSAR